jgi:hypothetical protein
MAVLQRTNTVNGIDHLDSRPEETTMFRIAVTVLASVSLTSVSTLHQATVPKPAFLDEALRTGRLERVKPHDLLENGRVNGAVYTPFVRVAMLSQAAGLNGRTLSVDDVPPEVYEPLVYFVMRWSDEHDWPRVLEHTARQSLQVTMVPAGFPPSHQQEVLPVWTTEDLGVLARFGAHKPFADAAIVAAFPVENLRPGFDVMTFVPVSGDTLPPGVKRRYSVRVGRLTSDDLARWR